MTELINLLNNLPGSYPDFVSGICTYAEKKPERIQAVLNYMKRHKNMVPSDVVKFVMDQPDFQEDNVAPTE